MLVIALFEPLPKGYREEQSARTGSYHSTEANRDSLP